MRNLMFTEAELERNLKKTSRPVTLVASELYQGLKYTMLSNISYQIPCKFYDVHKNKRFGHVA